MGIPQLRRHLEPFAERTAIEAGNVVLDGPALAYQVLSLCSRTTRKTSPFEQPSYELLGRTALAWLEKAEDCGLSVSALYFDSYLPDSKRPERIQRLIKSSRDLIKYHSAFLAGVPKPSGRHVESANVELFPNAWPMEKKAKPPPPPFLVPAVIDALRSSSKFGPLVRLVPGEADGFCAQHVRQSGGIILTSDSDLLVYDLGETGAVVFFADIDLDTETHRLIAPQYRQAELCRRLSLKSETGLQHLAFEVSRDPHLTLEQAADRVKRGEETSTPTKAYSEFIEQYLSPEVVPELDVDQVWVLDPRVSEIILRSLQTSETAGQRPGSDEPSGSMKCTMYLPFLLDCPSRTSAWEASKPVRQLAYAVLQSVEGSNMPAVFEMRRLQTISSGLKVDIPNTAEADDLGASLLALLSKIEAGVSSPDLVWVVLAFHQDMMMTLDRGRGYPLSLELLNQQARGRLDPCSWEFLHLVAQTQATYYSLRMLRQVLDFSVQHTGALSSTLSELAGRLSCLPSLPEFPTVGTFEGRLRVLRETSALEVLSSLCADHEDVVMLVKSIQNPGNNKKSKKRKSTQPGEGNSRQRSSNPFDLLARGEE